MKRFLSLCAVWLCTALASAPTGTIPFPFFNSNIPVVTLVNAEAFTQSSNSTCTSSTVTVAPGNLIVAVVSQGNIATGIQLSSATIGGGATTILASEDGIVSSAIVQRVATSTTGTVITTWDDPTTSCGFAIFEVSGLNSATAVDSASSSGAGTTVTVMADVSAEGVAIAGAALLSSATAFSGVAQLYNETDSSLLFTTGGASNSLAAEINRSFSVTHTDPTNYSISAATWR